MTELLGAVSNGIGLGSIYALLALGFVIIYKSMRVISFASLLGNFDAMYQLYFHYYSTPDAASQSLARLWLDRSVDAGVNPARLRLAVHLLATDGDKPGTGSYDDAVSLLDDAYAAGYNTARKFSQTTTSFKLPTPGEKKE